MGVTSTTHIIIYLIILTAVLIIKGVLCVTDKFTKYVFFNQKYYILIEGISAFLPFTPTAGSIAEILWKETGFYFLLQYICKGNW